MYEFCNELLLLRLRNLNVPLRFSSISTFVGFYFCLYILCLYLYKSSFLTSTNPRYLPLQALCPYLYIIGLYHDKPSDSTSTDPLTLPLQALCFCVYKPSVCTSTSRLSLPLSTSPLLRPVSTNPLSLPLQPSVSTSTSPLSLSLHALSLQALCIYL